MACTCDDATYAECTEYKHSPMNREYTSVSLNDLLTMQGVLQPLEQALTALVSLSTAG